MRTATAAPVTSLLGSLGLHAFAVLVLFLVVRNSAVQPDATRPRPDAWQGNAVEVDAIATPEAAPNIANAADSPIESAAAAAAVPAPNPAPPRPPPPPPEGTPARAPPPPAPPQPPAPADPPPPSREAASTGPAEPLAPSKPRPRPRPRPVPVTPASGAESRAEASTGSHQATTSAATGAFGAEGLPIGVRSLPGAF